MTLLSILLSGLFPVVDHPDSEPVDDLKQAQDAEPHAQANDAANSSWEKSINFVFFWNSIVITYEVNDAVQLIPDVLYDAQLLEVDMQHSNIFSALTQLKRYKMVT